VSCMQEFYRYVEDHSREYISELQRLLREPSIGSNTVGISTTVSLLEKIMRRMGCEVHQIVIQDSKPFLFAEIGEGERSILFYNHYDVQPVEPLNHWEFGPFMAEVKDGHIYARGAADNKGNLFARLAAVETYLKVNGPLPCRVKFLFEGEEEVGSPHIEAFVRRHAEMLNADLCFWESGTVSQDGRPLLSFGMKGLAYLEMRCRTLPSDVHSSWAPIIDNPAWRLLYAMSSIRNETGELTIDGLADHIEKISDEEKQGLADVEFDFRFYRDFYKLREFLNPADERQLLERYFFSPTSNISGIHSGYTKAETKTVIPHEAWANLDFRLVPNMSPELVVGLLRSHLNRRQYHDVDLTLKCGLAPYRCQPRREILDEVGAACREVFHGEPIFVPMMAASGPMHHVCSPHRLPVISFSIAHPGSHIHAPNENIRIQDLLRGIMFIGRILETFS